MTGIVELMNRTLTLTVMPDRTFISEWIESDKPLSPASLEIQDTLFERFSQNNRSWLFYLGFHEPNSELSLSLNYFMSIAALFVQKLSRIPDLEALRHQVVPEISPEEWDSILQDVPMMTGSDYIDGDFLNDIWAGLTDSFSHLILSTIKVDDFILNIIRFKIKQIR